VVEAGVHQRGVERPHERPRAAPEQRRNQRRVIRVQVRRDEIRPLEVYPDLVETVLQDFTAVRPIHARVDDQVAIVRRQDIGVDLPERIPGEGNHHAVEPRQYLFEHLLVSHSFRVPARRDQLPIVTKTGRF
jgi:hypothetical protein